MKLTSLILLLCLSFNLLADDSAVWLNKNDPAPFDGLLLKEKKAQDIRLKLLDNASFIKSIELYKQNEELYKQQILVFSEQNDKLSKSLNDERSSNTWGRIALILTGVVLTVGAGIALRQASK